MPKKAPIDKELATKIKAAMKKKMHFVAVVKSPQEGALFVSKTKIDKEAVAESKETLGGGKTFKGTCHGENGALVFSVNKEPPATLGPVLARYAKTYAGVKIKAVARFDKELADEVDLKSKSKESLDRRAMTKAVNEAMSGQDEDIHRKRKIGPTTKDRDYLKNVTGPANAALLKASEELMTGTKLSPGTVKELQTVLVQLAEARKAYGAKITGGTEKDQQRQKKVLAIAKREEAIKKILSQAAGSGKSSTVEEESESEVSELDAKSIAKELKNLSVEISSVGTSLSPGDRKSLQLSLKKIQSFRESGSFEDAKEELDTARRILSQGQSNPYVTTISQEEEEEEVDLKTEAKKRGYGEPRSLRGEDEEEVEESKDSTTGKTGTAYTTTVEGLKLDRKNSITSEDSTSLSEDELSEEEKGDSPLRSDSEAKKPTFYSVPDNLVPEGSDSVVDSDEEEENPFDDSKEEEEREKFEDKQQTEDKSESEDQEEVEEEVPVVILKANVTKIRGAADQWRKSTKAISQQVNTLQAAVLKVNDGRSAGIARGLNRIVTSIPSLAPILEELASAKEESDNKALGSLLPQAKKMVDAADKLATSNALFASADANPFVKVQITKILGETVKAARQVLQ